MEKEVVRPRTEEELLQEVKNVQTSKEEAVRILKDLEDKLAANAYPALARPLVRSTAAQLKETIQKMETNLNTLKQELSTVQKAAKEASKTAETASKETVETVETSASETVETAAKGTEEKASKAANEAANEAGKEAGKESAENTAKKTVDSLKDSVLNRFGKGSGTGGSDGNSSIWNQKLVFFCGCVLSNVQIISLLVGAGLAGFVYLNYARSPDVPYSVFVNEFVLKHNVSKIVIYDNCMVHFYVNTGTPFPRFTPV